MFSATLTLRTLIPTPSPSLQQVNDDVVKVDDEGMVYIPLSRLFETSKRSNEEFAIHATVSGEEIKAALKASPDFLIHKFPKTKRQIDRLKGQEKPFATYMVVTDEEIERLEKLRDNNGVGTEGEEEEQMVVELHIPFWKYRHLFRVIDDQLVTLEVLTGIRLLESGEITALTDDDDEDEDEEDAEGDAKVMETAENEEEKA